MGLDMLSNAPIRRHLCRQLGSHAANLGGVRDDATEASGRQLASPEGTSHRVQLTFRRHLCAHCVAAQRFTTRLAGTVRQLLKLVAALSLDASGQRMQAGAMKRLRQMGYVLTCRQGMELTVPSRLERAQCMQGVL